MNYNSLSDTKVMSNGVKIPVIGYGTYKTPDGEVCANGVLSALRAGYRHIDTAEFYENEKGVGEGVRRFGQGREDIFITTKVWNSNQGYENTLKACRESLKRLGTDYADLYLIHWPNPKPYRETYPEKFLETWRAMETLYNDGYVRAIGTSNCYTHHLKVLFDNCRIKPMANQIEFHLGLLQEDTVGFCYDNGIVCEAWAPLLKGRAFGKEALVNIAEKYNKTQSQVLIRWCLQHGAVPLPKSVHEERIAENADVFDFVLDSADMLALDAFDEVGRLGSHPDTADF